MFSVRCFTIAFFVISSDVLLIVNAQSTIARAIIFQASNFTIGQPVVVMGTIDFTEQATGSLVQVRGTLTGLSQGLHGFHVHDKGDLGNGCLNAGGHFNPENKNHGGPTDTVRHVGDLGNVQAGADGSVNVIIDDSVIQLNGRHSIIGRAVVVHALMDDLGKNNTTASMTTGDAGARVACGVISIASDNYLPIGGSATHSFPASLLCLLVPLLVIASQRVSS